MKTSIYLYTGSHNRDIVLPPHIMEHIMTHKVEKKRLISMFNYKSLALVLKDYDLDINDLYFKEGGKPMIDGIYLSMSHTDETYGFAISKWPIGFDIQDMLPPSRYIVSRKLLTTNEYEEFRLTENKSLYLTTKWCNKEAYGKYLGTGLTSHVFNSEVDATTMRCLDNIISIYPESFDYDVYFNDKKIED